MKKPFVFLITGFGQSGKDTLANAIGRRLAPKFAKHSFADPLKVAANKAFEHLGLPSIDFRQEDCKKKHRRVLVAIAETAREEFVDVFAVANAKVVKSELDKGKSVAVADWRYENEHRVFSDYFGDRLCLISVERRGNTPANQSEAVSIEGVRKNCSFHFHAEFENGDFDAIDIFADEIVRHFGLFK